MKNILITGANSYIGTSVEKWLLKEPNKYHIETLDMKDENWKKFDFSKFDVVFHVAGIAHIKETKKNKDLYYRVNRDLAIETAVKAKESGVGHFIFLSTMSVYGVERGVITRNTFPEPRSAYGKSKYEAEKRINNLHDAGFKVLTLRPPMIYGPDSPGNFQQLVNFAKKTKFYPNFDNQRSMLYIDNLSILVEKYIKEEKSGIELPQNNEYSSTLEIINIIRKNNEIKIKKQNYLNYPVKIGLRLSRKVSKVFGNLVYPKIDYNNKLIPLEETLRGL